MTQPHDSPAQHTTVTRHWGYPPPLPPFPYIHTSPVQLIVSDGSGKQVWDSSKVSSNESTYVKYAGPALTQGTPYTWTVTTWTAATGAAAPCQSTPSAPATFITALFNSWDSSANFLSLQSTFGYFRKEVTVPSNVVSAVGFVTATLETPLLNGYKFYINGNMVDLGPGRGEAPVWDGDGVFRSLPYTTLDLAGHLTTAGPAVLALEGMHSKGSWKMHTGPPTWMWLSIVVQGNGGGGGQHSIRFLSQERRSATLMLMSTCAHDND